MIHHYKLALHQLALLFLNGSILLLYDRTAVYGRI
jgi:hypothetical protein